ncbi:unnamed protein product, partial [Gulo gulo]
PPASSSECSLWRLELKETWPSWLESEDPELVIGDPGARPLVLLLEQAGIELMLVQLGQVCRQRLHRSKLRGQLSRQGLQWHRLHHQW